MAASSVRFGAGVTREVGMDLADLGVRRVLVLTDPAREPSASGPDRPASRSKKTASRASSTTGCASSRTTCRSGTRSRSRGQSTYDAFVAVGGGSTIDTAKAVNLYTMYPPEDFLDYVNPPIGKGLRGPRTAQAADGDSDDRRHRQRNHRRQRVRCDASPRQDRNLQPPAEADARLPRSRQHADHAGAGRRVERARHPQPRGRVVHRAALHRAAAAGSAVAAASLSRLESDQRHLVARSAPHRVALSGPRGRRSVRR